MAKHKSIQNPEKFSEKDYEEFEYLLFAEDTSTEVLQEIVMTLAHLPAKRAQDLLARFNETDTAEEIDWLEPAMEEGKMWAIKPENEQEERDMAALKLYHEKSDQIVKLMGDCQVAEYRINRYEIELQALQELQNEELSEKEREDIKYRIIATDTEIKIEKNKLQATTDEIALQNKIINKIKESIKTERYKNLEAWEIAGFHFDGEE